MNRLLIVEDDQAITENLSVFLRSEGFEIVCAATVSEALKAIEGNSFDMALLDISLPDGNGYAVCRAIKEKQDTPVIFVTASDDEYSVITGLDMGADDYIAKPYRPRELLSRIRSVLRRAGKAQAIVELEGLKIDTVKGTVTKDGTELFLSALEYKLLLIFINNPGVVLSRTRLLNDIWDIAGDFVNDNTLTVYIKRLREKIEPNPAEPVIIKTVRGAGYIL